MKKADLVLSLRRFLDADTEVASNLKPVLTDAEIWDIFIQAVPELPQYRGAWGLSIYEQQFLPYYNPDTDALSLDPFAFSGASNVLINDSLYLDVPPGSGWVLTTPTYEFVSVDAAQRIKTSDPNYKRNIYHATRLGGYVSLYDYDSAAHGDTDGNFYRLKKYPGILQVKVEAVTEDAAGRTVGFDLSLDGGRSWIGSAVGCALDADIDVSAYPSTIPVLKIIVASADSTSPRVRDLRVNVWQVEDLDANHNHILNLAHAIWLERLADRAAAAGNNELHQNFAIAADRIRQRVAGRIGGGKVSVPEGPAPQVALGPANKYASHYFRGR